MTSNICTEFITERDTHERIREKFWEALRRSFRPEFLNRIDEVIVFNRLTKEHIQQIVDLQFERLKQRLADKRITLELSEAARAKLAELGYDPTFGARPLRRTMERHIANPLAKMVISGQIKEGDHVRVDYDEQKGEFTFTVLQRAEVAAA